ncbi:MAG: Fic family protein [Porphyromonas sp.]|nr:Fic family protein [Porphyromonas sp.]
MLQADRFITELIPPTHKRRYLMSALMEEAIRSSQIEGAATTRRVAKEMLRKNITPRDRSQRMILNNYRTMALLQEQRNAEMTEELLLQIHRSMVRGTLEHSADEGRCRTEEDDVYVANELTKEVVHTPPPASELSDFMQFFLSLCNDREQPTFIHPILRGIIIHFLIGYMHPFVDGNGRTARALFFWYMLRSGYSLLEYLSISQVIYNGKSRYEEAYLKVETDDLDLGYFVQYHLKVLRRSIESFKSYAEQKLKEQESLTPLLRIGGLNERQMHILRLYQESDTLSLTGGEVVQRFGVTLATAKSDLKGLVERGFLDEIAYNKVKRGYLKSSHFDGLLNEASVR